MKQTTTKPTQLHGRLRIMPFGLLDEVNYDIDDMIFGFQSKQRRSTVNGVGFLYILNFV
jgi:hypothetical protein